MDRRMVVQSKNKDDLEERKVEHSKNIDDHEEGKVEQSKNKDDREERSLPLSCIPGDIRIEILVKIPAPILLEKLRYLSKSCFKDISSSNFIYQNAFHQKQTGILLQVPTINVTGYHTYLLEMDKSKLKFNSTRFGPKCMGLIASSCNGLILERDQSTTEVLHVKNVLTSFALTLPNTPSHCEHINCRVALGFNPVTNEFKVVHIDKYGIECFTIGVDKEWRSIPGLYPTHYDHYTRSLRFRWWNDLQVVSVDGHYLHWKPSDTKYLISMDIWDEEVSKTKLPDTVRRISNDYDLVEMDGKLSYLYKTSLFTIEVWVLKDFKKSIWSMEHFIDVSCMKYRALRGCKACNKKDEDGFVGFFFLRAVAILTNGDSQEILFHGWSVCDHNQDLLYVYDIKHGEMRRLVTNTKYAHILLSHKTSLISEKELSDFGFESGGSS